MDGHRPDAQASRETPSNPLCLSLGIHWMLDGFVRHPMNAEFRFDPDCPLVVALTLAGEQGASVTWHISRELLHKGLRSVSGSGDVRVWPAGADDGASAWLLLDGRNMRALFDLPVPPLEDWLEHTYRVTPPEAETDGLDWDAFITELLDTPGPPTDSRRCEDADES